jgi:hypothetical protein
MGFVIHTDVIPAENGSRHITGESRVIEFGVLSHCRLDDLDHFNVPFRLRRNLEIILVPLSTAGDSAIDELRCLDDLLNSQQLFRGKDIIDFRNKHLSTLST